MSVGIIDWSPLAPPPKCPACNGTGSAAPRVAGLLNYVMCRTCSGRGVVTENKRIVTPILDELRRSAQ